MSPRRRLKRVASKSEPPDARKFRVGSLGAWLEHLGVELADPDWIPTWPPDAFAISAAFLQRTGGYIELMHGSGATRTKRPKAVSSRTPAEIGAAWRDALTNAFKGQSGRLRDTFPSEIQAWWRQFRLHACDPLTTNRVADSLTQAACNLCAASDSASVGIGIEPAEESGSEVDADPFLAMAQELLSQSQQRSFCLIIHPDALAVLGKQHTPQRGCTIRSLSHNLALYTPREILARWDGPYRPSSDDPDVLNLLLLPWPIEVRADDFTMSRNRQRRPETAGVRTHRYFEYSPKRVMPAQGVARAVKRALDTVRRHTDQIHGIVFPELSLTMSQFFAVERVAVTERAMLVAGVRASGRPVTRNKPANFCAIQPIGLTTATDDAHKPPRSAWDKFRLAQHKHHRWCLDRDQIMQYELGGRLPASYDCWEQMYIGKRRVNFVTLGSWLTMCVLICEDLARQDPVSEVIRAVGPNLVFALLMDGPQLRNRWPARYASVLAEDPGCSVLTMTSLGMAARSRRRSTEKDSGEDKSRTIALWRDAIFGEQEISLKAGDNACVVSLVCRSVVEHTIDGRADNGQAHFPVFAGVRSFAVPGKLP
jgi:hypothetical protein